MYMYQNSTYLVLTFAFSAENPLKSWKNILFGVNHHICCLRRIYERNISWKFQPSIYSVRYDSKSHSGTHTNFFQNSVQNAHFRYFTIFTAQCSNLIGTLLLMLHGWNFQDMLSRFLGVYPEIFSPIPRGKAKKNFRDIFTALFDAHNAYFQMEILEFGKNNVLEKN